jgi:tetratricopeptide (TPR) repeat protein
MEGTIMRITNNEELKFEEGRDIVFFLGQDFSLEGTNLLKIIPNLKSKSYIINESEYDLEKLCPYYNIETVILKVDHQLIEEAVYLFLQVNNSDLNTVRKIIEKRPVKEKNHILLNNPELYYYFSGNLKSFNVTIHVPKLPSHNPIKVSGIEKVENPFYYSNLFGINNYIDLYWGDILEEKLGVRNAKGNLYKYLDNVYKEKKNELESLLKYKIPSKALDLTIEKFKSRPLTVKESIEKSIMEGDYEHLPELTETLIKGDNSQFINIYDWIKYLEGKAPNKVIQGMLDALLKSDDIIIDNTYLPLVYEKLAITYQKEGDFESAAKTYRKFSNLENINGELKNVSSDFLRKEIELLYLAGDYEEIINLCVEDKLSILGSTDAPNVALCIALAHNETGDYEKALQSLKGEGEEKEFLRNVFKLNKGEAGSLFSVKQFGFSKIALYNEMLTAMALIKDNQYLDTIKVFNRMKEILGKPQNLIGRRALLLVSLFKARALEKIGNVRESLNEHYKNLENHKDEFINENRSVVLEIIYEISELEKSMNNLSKSLEFIEKGLAYEKEIELDYDVKARIKLLLLKLEIVNSLGKDDKDVVKLLEDVLKDRNNTIEFKPLQVKMNGILVKAYISNSRIGDALDLVESSYEKYQYERDEDIELEVLDMLELAKEQYMNTEAKAKGSIQLKRIIDKYSDNVKPDIRIRTGLALKEIADYKLDIGDDDGAMESYKQLIDGYAQSNYKKLEGILKETIIKQGEILYKKGRYYDARVLIMEIEGKLDSDIDAARELLLAKCNEKLGNIDLAIGGYEEYLQKTEDKDIKDEEKIHIYKTLSVLLSGLKRNRKAIDYLDRILNIETEELALLETSLKKGCLLYDIDKEKGYLVYKDILSDFGANGDNKILDPIVNGCSKVMAELTNRDLPLYLDIINKALDKFNELTNDAKLNIYEALGLAAEKLKEAGKIKEEELLRKKLVKYYGDVESSEYKLESAYSYLRILEIDLIEDNIPDLESSWAQYKSYFIGKKEDYAKQYYHQGMLLYGKEFLKRNEYNNAKKILGELLSLNDDIYIGKLYYGQALNALGEKRKALKEFKEIVDNDISGELFVAVLEKIKLVKRERSLFGGNIKKMIQEIEERIIPIINTSGSNINKITIGYELALLYKDIKNADKYQELLRGLIEKYSKYEDADLVERLKVIYKELDQ